MSDEFDTVTENNRHLLHLSEVEPGKELQLVGITGNPPIRHRRMRRRLLGDDHCEDNHHAQHRHHGRKRMMKKRLLDLGLTKGCTFKVIQSSGNGPVLIEIRGTRIALGHRLASQVIVREVESS